MYEPQEYVTVKISKKAHSVLNKLRHELYLDTYPQVVDRLIEEHIKNKGDSLKWNIKK